MRIRACSHPGSIHSAIPAGNFVCDHAKAITIIRYLSIRRLEKSYFFLTERRSISLWFSYNLWPELACIQRSSSQIKLEKLRVPLSANLSWFEVSSQLQFRKESITVILMLRKQFKIWIRCSRLFCSIQGFRMTAGTS